MPRENESRDCPYFDVNDPLCGERFTLEHMSEVFEICLGQHERCPIFQELVDRRPVLVQLRLARAG